MNDFLQSLQQLFVTPSPIAGISVGMLVFGIVGVLALIGGVVVMRVFGEIGGFVLRIGCFLIFLFLCAAGSAVVFLNLARR
jgi:hypothetical protein